MSERPYSPSATRAVISYLQIGIFAMTVAAIFWIILWSIEVSPLMAGILGTLLGTTSQGFSAVRSYWLPGGGIDKPAPAGDGKP